VGRGRGGRGSKTELPDAKAKKTDPGQDDTGQDADVQICRSAFRCTHAPGLKGYWQDAQHLSSIHCIESAGQAGAEARCDSRCRHGRWTMDGR
jgi:hypothetical protein